MDTTLFTFMLETHPSVQSVSLVGSWDNFTKHYTMERDARRDRGQWRGCHSFKNIVCDGDRPATSRRNGGLKMGQPYYFYYELDGTLETHDPTRPSTSACPYLPGQTVNVMFVPSEKSERQRSASLGSIRTEDFQTMEPSDKFVAPRPAPPIPALPDFLGPAYRLPTAPATTTLKHHKSDRAMSRSISPTPSWWSPRKLFTRKHSTSSQSSVCPSVDDVSSTANDQNRCSTALSTTTTESSRMRAMSPESLRRFLSDDTPLSEQKSVEEEDPLALSIPDDLAEDDDDDFLISAVSEFGPKTILSPPPVSRHNSSSTSTGTTRRVVPADNCSSFTLRAEATSPGLLSPRQLPQRYTEEDTPTSRFSFSSDEGFDSDDEADDSPVVADNDTPAFYHSDADIDDDDYLSPPPVIRRREMGRESLEQSLALALDNYRLPRDDANNGCNEAQEAAEEDASVSVVTSPPLLALPIIDDFVSELKSAGLSF